jgi:hypothetical protein
MNGLHDYSTYDYGGREEFRLTTGDPVAERCLLIIPPLFDEMNRMRRVLVSAARMLGPRGMFVVMPDLPGTNESLAPLSDQTLAGWRQALAAAAGDLRVTHIVSVRGGALIDNALGDLPVWRLAPAKGASLLKTMIRTRIASDKENGVATTSEVLLADGRAQGLELAGNMFGAAMIADLESAVPHESPAIMLGDLGDKGSALWLRAEPQDDPVMAAAIADALDIWSASCGG